MTDTTTGPTSHLPHAPSLQLATRLLSHLCIFASCIASCHFHLALDEINFPSRCININIKPSPQKQLSPTLTVLCLAPSPVKSQESRLKTPAVLGARRWAVRPVPIRFVLLCFAFLPILLTILLLLPFTSADLITYFCSLLLFRSFTSALLLLLPCFVSFV